MASSHAVGLARLSPSSPFLSWWWLPQGWATQGFVMLSGFTVATLFAPGPSTTHRVLRRAWQLLCVMFVSNLVMLLLKYAVIGQWPDLGLAWWIGLVTLRTPYSLSIVLLPIAAFLCTCPALLALRGRVTPPALLAAAVGADMAMWAVTSTLAREYNGFSAVLFTELQLLPLVADGALGFALGNLWKATAHRWRFILGTIAASFGAGWAATFAFIPIVSSTAAAVLHFTLVLGVGAGLDRSRVCRRSLWVLPLIGTYGLFSFISHRVVIQTLVRVPSVSSADLRYVIAFAGGMAVVAALCVLRRQYSVWDHALRRIYL